MLGQRFPRKMEVSKSVDHLWDPQELTGKHWCRSAYHGHKVQQIHARFVGFGVSQFEQRGDTEAGSVSSVAPLCTTTQKSAPIKHTNTQAMCPTGQTTNTGSFTL